MHRVGVHDPRHGLFAGADVRRWNVALGANPIRQFRGISPRQALHFSARQFARIADDSPLGAAERNVHHRAFPRHPRRQRAHFINRNIRRETNPAFSRPPYVRMQNAVPREHFQLPVIHSHRDVQSNFLARPLQEPVQPLFEAQLARGYFKTRFRVLVDVHLFQDHGLRHVKFSFADFPHSASSRGSAGSSPCPEGRARQHSPAVLVPSLRDRVSLHNSSCERFTGVISGPRKVSFAALPHRQTCHLAGPPVYEPAPYPAS